MAAEAGRSLLCLVYVRRGVSRPAKATWLRDLIPKKENGVRSVFRDITIAIMERLRIRGESELERDDQNSGKNSQDGKKGIGSIALQTGSPGFDPQDPSSAIK